MFKISDNYNIYSWSNRSKAAALALELIAEDESIKMNAMLDKGLSKHQAQSLLIKIQPQQIKTLTDAAESRVRRNTAHLWNKEARFLKTKRSIHSAISAYNAHFPSEMWMKHKCAYAYRYAILDSNFGGLDLYKNQHTVRRHPLQPAMDVLFMLRIW